VLATFLIIVLFNFYLNKKWTRLFVNVTFYHVYTSLLNQYLFIDNIIELGFEALIQKRLKFLSVFVLNT